MEEDNDAGSVISYSSSVEDSILSHSVIRGGLQTYQSLSSVTNGDEPSSAISSLWEYCVVDNKEPPTQSIFL